MDENANANAQGTQANPATEASSAANATNPPVENKPEGAKGEPKADPQAEVSFDPEIQKFLDNQNIKTDDLKAAVTELAKRNMKLRGSQKEPQSVTEVLQAKEEPKPNPIQQAMEGTKPQPTQPVQPTQPQPQPQHQPRVPSDMDIANVSMFVKQQYPDVTTDAKFYKSMIEDGFKPVTADGQINLKSVLSYANYQQKLITADKTIKASEPQAGQIPAPSDTPEYAKVELAKTMDETAAENIILFSNNEKKFGRPIHPQYNEAVKFLQDMARKGK